MQDVQRLLHALYAVDRFLHMRIEILHAQAGPVEAQPRQHGDIAGIDEARIEFDREIALRRIAEIEAPAQPFHQRGHRLGIEEVRRTTAQMQLDDLTAVLELRCQQVGLGQHARDVAVAPTAVAGDHPVAAAVEAGLEQNGTCTYSDSARASWLLSAIAWRSAGASKPSWKCGAVGYEV
jgi:hypothetical protein